MKRQERVCSDGVNMPVIGVITCRILELEFAHLLSQDRDITAITVLADRHSLGVIAALESNGSTPGRIPILREFRSDGADRLEVLVRVMELALHNRKRNLQNELVKAAREMGRHVDALVLGYGLCGNALEKPHELLADAGVPIFIPMDRDHPVDDCVGLIIGGRERYYGEQCRVAGTFFMIPGWTRHWKTLFEKEYGKFDVEFTRRIFGMSNYERSLLIPNPALPVEQMRENIAEFNRLFGFRTDLLEGSLDILYNTWHCAKKHLQGETQSQ
ncbi:MAG: DUF1638 domain-containing protein [Desulfobacteraceae bacterium]